ncbi:UNVERIFIED_CONTAM: hypothetical protein Sradi_3627300 [Sesamum radiatum]|uniref:GRF-type domain-containing protein n=1 Tax=Sesamum radiatum TaxID=300843 RepID=A0AAW2QHN8_SESRA
MDKDRSSYSTSTYSDGSSTYKRRPYSSTESRSVELCICGNPQVTKTAWTNSNPGRRFRGCSGLNGGYCNTFEWVDPPMCPRRVVLIPGLLKKINGYEKKLVQAEAVRANLEFKEKMWRICVIILFFFICLTMLGSFGKLLTHKMPPNLQLGKE